MPTKEELGKRLKNVRLEKGFTLKEVETLSGVSMTHTSQIERGMTSPTVGALEKLARALDRTASYFMEEELRDEISYVRRDERGVSLHESSGIRLERLTAGIPGGIFHFYLLRATPVVSEPEHRKHDGEEAVTVLKGCLDVVVGGRRFRLKSGESLQFKSSKPHALFSSTRSGAEAIWVGTTPPQF